MLKLLLILIYLFEDIESAKILGVFPAPSISHQIVFRPLMLELAKRGHEVTVITADPAFPKDQAPQNFKEIDVHDISYDHWNNFITEKGKERDALTFFQLTIEEFFKIIEIQLKSADIKKLFDEQKKFDLLFIESCMKAAHIYSHVYNAPVIEISSGSGVFSAFEMTGAASHPLIYPDVFHRRIYNLTMWEKLTELYNHYMSERIVTQQLYAFDENMKSIFGPDTPNVDDLRRNIDMLFVNVPSIWESNRPVPPNVVYLGGLHQKPHLELPKDLKSYLDSSKNGVIYISFGTNVKPSMLPSDKLKIFTDVFSQLPYDVLWKWDKDELPGRSENIRISKWLPQSDMLRHPKIKLFITQGGMQSTDEAMTAGVPLIGVPMIADQWYNVEQYVKFKIGKGLRIETLTAEQLLDAINSIIDDESYRKNIVKLRDIMTDQPQSPLERAVWWTEHVLRHGGGAHLRAPAAHMSWTDYYELELVLLLLTTFLFLYIVSQSVYQSLR